MSVSMLTLLGREESVKGKVESGAYFWNTTDTESVDVRQL